MKNNFFLASFPRAGNTWVRFLIANIYNAMKNEFPEIDFFNIHDIIPEMKSNENELPVSYFRDLPRVIKTHSRFTCLMKSTILILRNPFDSLYSYWDLVNFNMGIELTLAEVVKHEEYGIQAIVGHTNSFIRNCQNLLISTYENLNQNTHKELEKICDFLNIQVNHEIIDQAIKKSSFNCMSKIEQRKGRKLDNENFRFIREGKIGNGVKAIKKDNWLYHFVIRELRKSPLLYFLYS